MTTNISIRDDPSPYYLGRREGIAAERAAIVASLREPSDEMVEAVARTQCSAYGLGNPDFRMTFGGASYSRWEIYKPMAKDVMLLVADTIECGWHSPHEKG